MLQSILIASTTCFKVVPAVIVIRARVGFGVLEGVQQLVEPASQESTEQGAQPVDPVVVGEVAVDNGWADRTGRVETAAGEVDAFFGLLAFGLSGKGSGWTENLPTNSDRNKAKPMAAGAEIFPLCFSTAIIKMTNTNSHVRNSSMKKPWTALAPPPKVVSTAKGPGNITDTNPAAAVAPRI